MASTSAVPTNPTSHNIASLLPKLADRDGDIRFMTLGDLQQMLIVGHATFLSHDYTTCARLVDALLPCLTDTSGDCQNAASKTLAALVPKVPDSIVNPLIEKVSNLEPNPESGSSDNTVAALSLRTVVLALARNRQAYDSVSKALIPRLTGKVVIPIPGKNPPPPKGMLQIELETGQDTNALDLLAAVAECFGTSLQTVEVEALMESTMQILESPRTGSVLKKKATSALSSLAGYFSDGLLSQLVSSSIEKLRQAHTTPQQRRLYIAIYGALARSIPVKFGPYLKTLAPFVLAPLSQDELDQQEQEVEEGEGERSPEVEEVREASLLALEAFLESCATDIKSYTPEIVAAATRFLTYDPTTLEDEDEEMTQEDDDEAGFEGDEDFEEETGFEDDTDVSYKLRRNSAKVSQALIATLSSDDTALYTKIAPALIQRMAREKEESVRNEVVSTLSSLVRRIPSASPSPPSGHQPSSRKRRRGDSTEHAPTNGYASPSTPPPSTSAAKGLEELNPSIVSASAKLLKTSTPSTKVVVLSLLHTMVSTQSGGLSKSANEVLPPVVESLRPDASAGAAGVMLRNEALTLLRVITENHSSKVLHSHLESIVPALTSAVKDRQAKLAHEGVTTLEAVTKALTPPRSSGSGKYLASIYAVLTEVIQSQSTDTAVRQQACQALGLLIGRTSGSQGAQLLPEKQRFEGQRILGQRLANELTRLACVRAVDQLVSLSARKEDFLSGWVASVALELAAQLRKSSRSLRGASLQALRTIASTQASRQSLDGGTVQKLLDMLLPLVKIEDLHMLTPALSILAALAKDFPGAVVDGKVVDAVCGVVRQGVEAHALDALVSFVEEVGKAGAGQTLMQALLRLGVQGNTDVTGQVIGTLLTSSPAGSTGVQLQDFIKELNSQQDESRQCLALSVLGEAGLRSPEASLAPETFTKYFDAQSEKLKLASAVALGRAGAGSVSQYLPRILDSMSQGRSYLLLHSVKELLQHSAAEEEIKPLAGKLWDAILHAGSGQEDNKVLAAECLGRLAVIAPQAYLPQLQSFLGDPQPNVRALVVMALPHVFADSGKSLPSIS